jgi:hypothetical protein
LYRPRWYWLDRAPRLLGHAALVCAACLAISLTAGCSNASQSTTTGIASSETTDVASAHMAGPPVEVHVPQSAVDAAPGSWDLSSPVSAVKSYLAWVTYADRIGQSTVASPTMSANEEVRVDSYIQFYLEKSRLIDQRLASITFGHASTGATSTLVPTNESWTYSYLSVAEGNAVVGGPYAASYDATYTVVERPDGSWVVDLVTAKARDAVK